MLNNTVCPRCHVNVILQAKSTPCSVWWPLLHPLRCLPLKHDMTASMGLQRQPRITWHSTETTTLDAQAGPIDGFEALTWFFHQSGASGLLPPSPVCVPRGSSSSHQGPHPKSNEAKSQVGMRREIWQAFGYGDSGLLNRSGATPNLAWSLELKPLASS